MFLKILREIGLKTASPRTKSNVNELLNNFVRAFRGALPEDELQSFRPEARSGKQEGALSDEQKIQIPNVSGILTNLSLGDLVTVNCDEIVAKALKGMDSLRSELLERGRVEMRAEKMKFDEREAALMAELKSFKAVEALNGFISTELPKRLMTLPGMTDARAAEIYAEVMLRNAAQSILLSNIVDANVRWSRTALSAMAQDREMLKMSNDLQPVDPRRAYTLFLDWTGKASDADFLEILKSLGLGRLMLLFKKGVKMVLGQKWREVAPVLPVGYRDNNDVKSAMTRATKGIDSVLYLSRQMRDFTLGNAFTLTVEDQRIATTELRELSLEVARAAILIYMAQDKKTQKAINEHPEQMLPLLRQYGVLSCVKIGKNGQLYVDLNVLMSAYVARQSIDQAA